MSSGSPNPAGAGIEMLLLGMVEQQEGKVLDLARRILPSATPDDVRQPHDVPELDSHPLFQFEDGILAGLRSALIAVQAEQSGPSCPGERS